MSLEFVVRNWNVLLAIAVCVCMVWHYIKRTNYPFAGIFTITLLVAVLMLKR